MACIRQIAASIETTVVRQKRRDTVSPMFLLLLLGFLVGNVLYGISTLYGRGLTRTISWLYFAAAFLTLTILSGELRGPTLPDTISEWLYPLLQPAARFLIGVWLWRVSDTDREPSLTGQVDYLQGR